MKFESKQCQISLNDLANYRELGAVDRSRLDLHLRRCESCRRAAEGLAHIEKKELFNVELSEDARNGIYDRLLPSIHEIAVDLQSGRNVITWLRPVAIGGGVLAAAAAVVVLAVMFLGQPQNSTIAHFTPSHLDSESVNAVDGMDQGRVDRVQGAVAVNGEMPSENDGKFPVEKGTEILVDDGSKVNFRIGELTKIALVDQTQWSVESISDERIALVLDRGKMAVEYDGTLGRILEIRTPESLVRVKGTVFTVEVFEDGATQVSVTRGEVEVIPNTLGAATSVTEGRLIQVPGTGRTVALGDRQRQMAAEVVALEDGLVASAGRLVTFDGSQEHVRVEVEDHLMGYTPLTVRLPQGPVGYRLSKPGMQPVVAWLANEQVSEKVQFAMIPSADYEPEVATVHSVSRGAKSKSCLNSEAVEDQEIKNIIVRAKAAMTAGDIPFASKLLEQTVRKVSGDQLVTATSLLAECYSAMGEYTKAADTFDRVATLVPGTAIAQNSRYEVGRLSMYHTGDYDRARNAFLSYVASPVGGQLQEDAYFSLCELYGREGVRNSALGCFNDYIRMFPDGHRNAHAHLWRGVLHQEVNQHWKTAERDLLKFIEARPRHPRCDEARYRIALGRYHVGDFAGATRMFREYMREHPGGQYRIRIERLKDAIMEKSSKKSAR